MTLQVKSMVDCSQSPHWHTAWAVREEEKAHQNKTKLSCAIYYGKLDWPTSELDREGGEREKKKERISRPKHHKEVSFYQKQATDAAAHARETKLYVLFVAVGKRAKQS